MAITYAVSLFFTVLTRPMAVIPMGRPNPLMPNAFRADHSFHSVDLRLKRFRAVLKQGPAQAPLMEK